MASVRRYQMPAGAPLDASGNLTGPFKHYLGGIEDVSKRVSALIEPLDGAATLSDVIDKVNELIAAMQTARQMESE